MLIMKVKIKVYIKMKMPIITTINLRFNLKRGSKKTKGPK